MRRSAFIVMGVVAAAACGPELTTSQQPLGSTTFVINAVYGGGGQTGASHRNDFIELRNVSSAAQSLSGLTLQYASSFGSSWSTLDLPPTSVPSGGYFLVQLASDGARGTMLPTPDLTSTIPNVALSDFKLALVTGPAALSDTCPRNTAAARIVDFLGTGAASCFEGMAGPQPSTTTAVARSSCVDTDNNSTDFSTAAPAPHNAASTPSPCGGGGTGGGGGSTTSDGGATGGGTGGGSGGGGGSSSDGGTSPRPSTDGGIVPGIRGASSCASVGSPSVAWALLLLLARRRRSSRSRAQSLG